MSFSAGALVEVRAAGGGFREGTVRRVSPDHGGTLTIELSPPPNEERAEKQSVTATMPDVRPRAPPPPADYVAGLEAGASVEALTSDGIWSPAAFLACKMLRSDGGARKCQCTVRMAVTGGEPKEETVDDHCVRPHKEWTDGAWVDAPGAALAHKEPAAANGTASGGEAAPGGAGGEAAPSAPPAPPVPTVIHPVAAGDAMEVTSFDEGLIGSWYEVKVVKLYAEGEAEGAAGQALVMYTAYPDNSNEWVDIARLRPVPPPNPTLPTPAAWTRRLTNGDPIELRYEQGWWEVQYLSRSGAQMSVLATRYGKVHTVSAAGMHPVPLSRQAKRAGVMGGCLRV